MPSRRLFGRANPPDDHAVVLLLRAAHGAQGEFPVGLFVKPRGERLPLFRVARKGEQVLRQRLVVARLEDKPVFAGIDQFAHAAHIRADGRAALADALKDRIREGFRDRGEQVDVHGREKFVDGRHPAAEGHAVGNAVIRNQAA